MLIIYNYSTGFFNLVEIQGKKFEVFGFNLYFKLVIKLDIYFVRGCKNIIFFNKKYY